MAFQPPNTGQERANRKILEELEQQKKRLRMQQTPGPAGAATPPPPPPPSAAQPPVPPLPPVPGIPAPPPPTSPQAAGLPAMILPDAQVMTPAQRTALQHATANSVGYFITQDSSFGNLILPVLPRFAEMPRT